LAQEPAPEPAPAPAEASPDEEAAPDPHTAEARALFETGRALADEHRWQEALERFRRSLELVDRPSTRFNLGASLYALERHAEAISELEHYLASADPALESATITEARTMLDQARAAIGELTIHLLPEDATVRVDGQPLEGGERRTIALDPGPHVLRVDAADHRPLLEEIHVAPGDRLLRAARLEPLPPPALVCAPRVDASAVTEPDRGVDPWVVVLTGALAAALVGAAVGIGYELSRAEAAPSGGSSGVVLAF
nr:hypothetical protein [Myxococcota bacterium]